MDPSETKLLIIEDSPRDRRIYQRTLRDFQIEFAESGEAGVEMLERGGFDLVVLDFQLPMMNGDEVLAAVRTRLGLDIPVIVVTGGGSENVAVELLKKGASDYITKDDLHTVRVEGAVRGAIERYQLDKARRRAEEELRRRRDELEQAIRQLQEAQARLVQSEKMASLGQLVAGVAHEINNPIAYVSNNLAILDRDVRSIAAITELYSKTYSAEASAEIREAEERIDLKYTLSNLDRLLKSSAGGIERVRGIVASLRDFSRLDETDRKPIDPNEAIRSTLVMVRSQARQKNVSLEFQERDTPSLVCWPGKINQVLLNLIMNAIQAVDEGSVIKLSVEHLQKTKEIVFVVSDNGPGIPDEIKGKIFDPFFTTKPQGVGTGLGLWVCLDIVAEHQGRIELSSTVGEGTTFRVILPQRMEQEPSS